MNSHCKNCEFHVNKSLPDTSKMAILYNDWCKHFAKKAEKAVTQCKMQNAKVVKGKQ